jgi:polyhydroxybutyrate depolymerase
MFRGAFFGVAFVLLLSGQFAVPATGDELESRTLIVNDQERSYNLHKSSQPIQGKVPLVVALHGGGGNGKAMKDTYGFKQFVATGECVAVYPEAASGGWVPEDIAFLDAMIDEVLRRPEIDHQQLFITGASRGGLATFVMASKSKHAFRAAGTVIASQLVGLARDYPIKKPLDFMMIAGTDDPLMPYRGGWGAMRQAKTTGEPDARVMPVEEMIGLLLKANAIDGSPEVNTLGNVDASDGCTNEVRQWKHSQSGRRVTLVKVIGGGHVTPGGRQYLPKDVIGPACNDFDHARVMWEFFRGKPVEAADAASELGADAEAAIRARVEALFTALRDGDIVRCLSLTDPQVIKDKGRPAAEKFFKGVSGLVRLAKVRAEDRVIRSIDSGDGGMSAKVEIELTLNGKSQPPGIEVWKKIDGEWYYVETVK